MSQKEQVLSFIKKHGSITPMQAYTKLSITALAERCRDLRESGHPIITVMEKRNGKRYARYSLKTKRPRQC